MLLTNTVPSNWNETRLKHTVDLKTDRVGEWSIEDNYIGLENIESWTGSLVSLNQFSEITDNEEVTNTTASCFEKGNVLFGKLRPYLAKAFVAKTSGVCSTELLVMRPRAGFLAEYLLYVLLTREFIGLVDAETFGTKMPRANWGSIGDVFIPVPPLDEQHAIADYLDRKTTKIDTLIAELDDLLKLIAEKRQATISQTVTRGINPNVKLVDSGIEWIGEMPEHWDIEFVRWLFCEIDERSTTGAEELLTVSHITGVTPRSKKDVNMFMAETLEGYKVCQSGDLIINTLWAWMGAMGVAFQEGIVSPSYHVYRAQADYEPHYIDYLVRLPNFAKEVTRHSKGVWSSRLRLYPDEFFNIILPVPPIEEQREIMDYLDKEITKLVELRKAVEETIELLQERRSALIAAAVTGKIRVTESPCR